MNTNLRLYAIIIVTVLLEQVNADEFSYFMRQNIASLDHARNLRGSYKKKDEIWNCNKPIDLYSSESYEEDLDVETYTASFDTGENCTQDTSGEISAEMIWVGVIICGSICVIGGIVYCINAYCHCIKKREKPSTIHMNQ